VRRVGLLLLTALIFALGGLVAGCGGGDKSSNTDSTATETTATETTTTATETTDTEDGFTDTSETIVGTSDAYKTGQAICGNNPIEILAQQYGVKATAEAISTAVSLQFTSAKDRADAKAGCLAALKAQ
jgi:hypothetical protein